MLLAVLIVSLIFGSACIEEGTLAVSLVDVIVANIPVTILPSAYTDSVTLVRVPSTIIMVTFKHQIDAFSMEFACFPMTLVKAHTWSHKHADAIWMSVFVNLTFIKSTYELIGLFPDFLSVLRAF